MILCVSTIRTCYGILFFKQKTAYEMRISDWSSDVCSSDLRDYAAPMAPATSLPRGSSPKPPQNGQDQAHAADRHGLKKRRRSPTPSASVKCGLYQQHRPRTAIEQALQKDYRTSPSYWSVRIR